MSTAAIKNRLQALEDHKNVERELPWDCKNLMNIYKMFRAEQEIIYKIDKIRGGTCNPPAPYKLEADDSEGASQEAREFLSLSGEKQGQAVDYYNPSKPQTEEEKEQFKRKFFKQLDRINKR